MKVIHKPNSRHECDIHSPLPYAIGTIVECERCGRRWKCAREGITFKGWRETVPSFLRRGPGKQPWGAVQDT